MSRLQVEVDCDLCAPYPSGTHEDPLPEMYARWVLTVWRVEQALHHAHGCDGTVRLRIYRTASIDGVAAPG